MFNYLKLQKTKSLRLRLVYLLSLARRVLTLSLGAHQLDSPSHYCKGYGLEIGSSDCPYPFAKCRMDYADFFNQQRASYLQKYGFISLRPPKCLLESVDYAKYDFVYASHVLEHTPNPLRSIKEWVRVVRGGGVIYLVIPNKQKTYDICRDVTPLAWFVERLQNDTWNFTMDETRLMVTKTKGLPQYEVIGDALDALCREIMDNPDGTHHYSVFDPISMIKFSELLSNLFNLEVANFQIIRHEMHLVMIKR
jgi:hypothetical protein